MKKCSGKLSAKSTGDSKIKKGDPDMKKDKPKEAKWDKGRKGK